MATSREGNTLDVLDFLTRYVLADLHVMELALFHWEKQVNTSLETADLISRWMYSTDQRHVDRIRMGVAMQCLQVEQDIERMLVFCVYGLKDRMSRTPYTPLGFGAVHYGWQREAATTNLTEMLLKDLEGSQMLLDTMMKEPPQGHVVVLSLENVVRREKFQVVQRDLLEIQELVKKPGFERQLLEGRPEFSGNCRAVEELLAVCYFMLDDCERKLQLLGKSLESLTRCVEHWRRIVEMTPR